MSSPLLLFVLFAAGPSSLWEDPRHARCAQLTDEGRRAQARSYSTQALAAWSEAMRLCPDEPEPFALAGASLIDAGDYLAARAALEHARQLWGEEGGDAQSAFHLGFVRALAGDLDGSLVEYRRSLSFGGLGLADNWLLYYDLGDTLMALGRLAEATDAYRRSARAAPLKSITHLALAVAYDRDQQLERARAELGIALSQDPQLFAVQSDQFIFVPAADRHYYLALGQLARGLQSRGRWELRQFLAQLPDGPYSARARERLAQAEAALPAGTADLYRILDGQVTELEPCVQRGWKGPLMLRRSGGKLHISGHAEPCLERWLSRMAPLLDGGDFDLDLEVTPH